MNTAVLAVVGLVLLILLSVCVGMSLDTEVQRRAWKRLAEERRLRAHIHRWTSRQQEQEQVLCARCPYRDLSRRRRRQG
jgi:hypothetical protein